MQGNSYRAFVDTQICTDAANGFIRESDWDIAVRYAQQTGEYCISASTFGEVITGIARGDQRYFKGQQKRLARLCPAGAKTFFDFPEYFLADTLGLPLRRPPNLETEFGFLASVILYAQSAADLHAGVTLPTGGATRPIDLGNFLAEKEQQREQYVKWFSTLKGKKKIDRNPEQWAAQLMTFLKVPPDTIVQQKLVDGLAAMYQFEAWLLDAARNKNYDLRKKFSDLIDAKQLYYLSDPTVVFITNDSDFRIRLIGNPQPNRILTFSQFLRHAEAKTSPLSEALQGDVPAALQSRRA